MTAPDDIGQAMLETMDDAELAAHLAQVRLLVRRGRRGTAGNVAAITQFGRALRAASARRRDAEQGPAR